MGIKRLIHNSDDAHKVLDGIKDRIAKQNEPDGRQPLEAARAIPTKLDYGTANRKEYRIGVIALIIAGIFILIYVAFFILINYTKWGGKLAG